MEINSYKLGQISRLSNVSTSEQVQTYVQTYSVNRMGDTNVGTLELSGNLTALNISSDNAIIGYYPANVIETNVHGSIMVGKNNQMLKGDKNGILGSGCVINANGGCHFINGYQCVISGNLADASHAEGSRTSCFAYNSHTEGKKTYIASGLNQCHAEGTATSCLGNESHVDGANAKTLHANSYVWNGNPGTEDVGGGSFSSSTPYQSNGIGTFNVNPTNGTKGFYVGNNSLCSILSSVQSNFVKHSGDVNIGPLHLSGNLSIDSGVVIGKTSHNNGNYSIAIGEDSNTYNKNSVAEGWSSSAGTRVFMIKSILSNENILSLDSTTGILPGHILSYKLDANYDAYSVVLSNLTPTTISIDQSITEFKNKNDASRINSSAKIWIVGHPELGSQSNNSSNQECACHAEGFGTIAQALASHAEGYNTKAVGRYSHAEGNGTSAIAFASHAGGTNSNAMHQNSYVWSGGNIYSSNGTGTFNINPTNGTKGFYVGDQSLHDILSSKIGNVLNGKTFDVSKANDTEYIANILSTIFNAFGGTVTNNK